MDTIRPRESKEDYPNLVRVNKFGSKKKKKLQKKILFIIGKTVKRSKKRNVF